MVDSSPRRLPARRANSRHPLATSLLLFPLAFTGCAHSQPSAPGATSEVSTSAPSPAAAAAPAPAAPARRWADEVLYFVVLDRFADGDTANDIQVDKKAPGAFHGGDFRGLREQLDELSSLGVTA